MPSHPDQEQQTHAEIIAAARQALISELGLEGSELAESFLRGSVGLRVRRGGVRASLARLAGDFLVSSSPGLRYGNFLEASDEVVVHRAASILLRHELVVPVWSTITLPFAQFTAAVTTPHGRAALAHALPAHGDDVTDLTQKLRDAPPTYPGLDYLNTEDIRRAFEPEPPLASDRREFYERIKLACAFASDRAIFDRLAKENPGFLDYLQCFPAARLMKRQVVALLGPTNSGKTYRAVLELSRARSGMYLG